MAEASTAAVARQAWDVGALLLATALGAPPATAAALRISTE